MRVLLVASVALFLLWSSVNALPARSFLEYIKQYSKKASNEDILFCLNNNIPCNPEFYHCPYDNPTDTDFKCRSKILLNLNFKRV